MEMARDEVRVMTVHGAKGLEAPIVILADTVTPPQAASIHQSCLLMPQKGRRPPPHPWCHRQGERRRADGGGAQLALGEARDEYRRLLYVAMTRAIERLIVCGVDGQKKQPEGCWYDLTRHALETHCIGETAEMAKARFCASASLRGATGEARQGAGAGACAAAAVADAKDYGGAGSAPVRPSAFCRRPRSAGPASASARRGGAPSCAATFCTG